MLPPTFVRAVVALLGVSAAVASRDICQEFASQGLDVDMPKSEDYEAEQVKYWSAACTALRPDCIVAPKTAKEMSHVVKTIRSSDVNFAVKSGGHSANSYHASIEDGILVSTQNLNQIDYDPETENAVVGPGLRWGEVAETLQSLERVVVGGRLGNVGVGGLILGGGLSFLSPQYGWSVHSVVNYELILADGTITNVNEESNPDLFAAMKGGGNNFGIVTTFTVKTYPLTPQIWGGVRISTPDKSAEVLRATRDFTEYNTDPKASVISSLSKSPEFDGWTVMLFYDGPEPPAEVFANFTKIETIHTTTEAKTYLQILTEFDEFVMVGKRYAIASETTPLPNSANEPEIFGAYLDHFNNITDFIVDVPGLSCSLSFQPLPKSVSVKAKELGGDLMNFDPNLDYIIFELAVPWDEISSDEAVNHAIRAWYETQGHLINQYTLEGKLPESTNPLYSNDIHDSQDYWGRIKDVEKARAVRREVDPDLFWQKRTSGGFRLG